MLLYMSFRTTVQKQRSAISLLATADLDLRGGKDWEPELVMEVLVARLARLGGAPVQRSFAKR